MHMRVRRSLGEYSGNLVGLSLLRQRSRAFRKGSFDLLRASSSLLVLAVALGAWSTGAQAQNCSTTAGVGQASANGAVVPVPGGDYFPSASGVSALLATGGGTLDVTAPVSAVSRVALASTACADGASTIRFGQPGSLVSRTVADQSAIEILNGSTVISNGTHIYTQLSNSDGIRLISGTYDGVGDEIVTGVRLGTNFALPLTYGRPVDAGGVLVADPSLYVSTTANNSNGIFAQGAIVRLNVDGLGSPLASTTSIRVIGARSLAGTNYAVRADNSTVTAANLLISNRNARNAGIMAENGATIGVANLDLTTLGADSPGIVTADALSGVTISGGTIATFGSGSHGVRATGGTIGLSSLSIATNAANTHGILATDTAAVSGSNLDIRTNLTGFGLNFTTGADGVFVDTRVTTVGVSQVGIAAVGAGSTLQMSGATIRTLGNFAHGALAQDGGSVTLSGAGSTFVVAGGSAGGLRSIGADSVVTATDIRVSMLGQGGTGLWALDGGRINAAAITVFASGGTSAGPGVQISGNGSAALDGTNLTAGVRLGTDASLATYGLPVDANGVLITNPALYEASGSNNTHGIIIANTGGRAWLNVDPVTLAPTGRTSGITTFGTSSSGIIGTQGGRCHRQRGCRQSHHPNKRYHGAWLFAGGHGGRNRPNRQLHQRAGNNAWNQRRRHPGAYRSRYRRQQQQQHQHLRQWRPCLSCRSGRKPSGCNGRHAFHTGGERIRSQRLGRHRHHQELHYLLIRHRRQCHGIGPRLQHRRHDLFQRRYDRHRRITGNRPQPLHLRQAGRSEWQSCR